MISADIVGRAIAEIKKGEANYRYFFEHLTSPEWIEPLVENDFFKQPPPPQVEAGYIRYPMWPESQYLARMAPKSPDIVRQVLAGIPNTENVRVHDDIVRATSEMPPATAARMVPIISLFFREARHALLLPEETRKLVAHLAQGGQVQPAISLIRAFLGSVSSDEGPTSMQSHEIEQLLLHVLPPLRSQLGVPLVEVLLERLNEHLKVAYPDLDPDDPVDLSYIERPAIEDHEQNWRHGLIDPLVEALRDTALFLINADLAEISDIVELIESPGRHLFSRVGMYVIAAADKSSLGLARPRLLDRAKFEEPCLVHEYSLLEKRFFADLTPAEQSLILDWIDDQDLEQIRVWLNQHPPEGATDERIQDVANRQRLERLEPIAAYLYGEWKNRYDEWVSQLGRPEHPDFVSYHSEMFIGPTSPISTEQLKDKTPSAVFDFLRAWRAPKIDTFGPTPEGLGRALADVVAERAVEFSQNASGAKTLSPTYVRHILNGLEVAIKAEKEIEWSPVLDLSQWVVAQGDIHTSPSTVSEEDVDWHNTRQQIASLLRVGLSKANSGPSREESAKIWTVLSALSKDPDPTPAHEALYGGNSMDPATMSINTVRGEAFHAIFQYLLWLKRVGELRAGLNEAPEVASTLETHLRPDIEPSETIRSVYGRYLPSMVGTDEPWVKAHVRSIFNPDEPKLSQAAWSTYLAFNRPYDMMLPILNSQYREAIMGGVPARRGIALGNSEDRLVDHVVTFYLRGLIELGDPDSLISLLVKEGTHKMWKQAIVYVGRILMGPNEVTAENIERAMALWEARFSLSLDATPASEYYEELVGFGWWLLSDRPSVEWLLTEAQKVINHTKSLEPIALVMPRLSQFANGALGQVFRLIENLLKVGDPWQALVYNQDLAQILRLALANPELSPDARTLVNFLGAKGAFQYRTLLQTP